MASLGSINTRDQTRRVDEQTRVDILTDSARVELATRRVRLEQLANSPNTTLSYRSVTNLSH